MQNKRLKHERVVREAEVLLAEALARRPNSRRPLRPGDIVRYYFHASAGTPPEAVLVQGYDRVEILRNKEPGVFLSALNKWVFRSTCAIMPHDSRMPRILEKIEAQIRERAKTPA